jgi:hypothetical protein
MELIPSSVVMPDSIPIEYIKNADDDCPFCLEEMKPKKNKLPIFDLRCADNVYHRFHIRCIMDFITKRLRLQATKYSEDSEDNEDSDQNDKLICPICSIEITMNNLKRINTIAQQYLYQLDVDQGVATRLFLNASIEQRNYKQLNQNWDEAIKLFREVHFLNFEYIIAIRKIFKHSEDYNEEYFLYYDESDKPAKAFEEAKAIFSRLMAEVAAAPKTKVTRKKKRKRKRKGSRK